MAVYRTKPTYVEATQFDGTNAEALGLKLWSKDPNGEIWILTESDGMMVTTRPTNWVVTHPDGSRVRMFNDDFCSQYDLDVAEAAWLKIPGPSAKRMENTSDVR